MFRFHIFFYMLHMLGLAGRAEPLKLEFPAFCKTMFARNWEMTIAGISKMLACISHICEDFESYILLAFWKNKIVSMLAIILASISMHHDYQHFGK